MLITEVVAAVSTVEVTVPAVEIIFIMAATTATKIFPTTTGRVVTIIGVVETVININHATKDHLGVEYFSTARVTYRSPNIKHKLGE